MLLLILVSNFAHDYLKTSDFGRMAKVLVQRAGSPDDYTRLTSFTWVILFGICGYFALVIIYSPMTVLSSFRQRVSLYVGVNLYTTFVIFFWTEFIDFFFWGNVDE